MSLREWFGAGGGGGGGEGAGASTIDTPVEIVWDTVVLVHGDGRKKGNGNGNLYVLVKIGNTIQMFDRSVTFDEL
jgi:hypothetical protein